MALTFIYGNSGSGKSEYIYRRVSDEASKSPRQRFYVVVPEQFTMYTQKRLVEHAKNGVIMNIDVVSFDRLAYRVFDELGIRPVIMEETGKSLVLRKIVQKHEDRLTVLKSNLKRMGYIAELKSVISELMQYGVSVSVLEEYLEKASPDALLTGKLRDILLIYRSFCEYLGDSYVTAEKMPEMLMQIAAESSLLRDAVFVFDGYTGFTPVQLNLIRRLMHVAKDIYVTVTLDEREDLYRAPDIQNLFCMSHKMVRSLAKAAGEAGFEIGEPVCIHASGQSRFANHTVLHFLEQNLFRMTWEPCRESTDGTIQIFSLADPAAELDFAVNRIRRFVRMESYRYRDFAIVCSDVERYEVFAEEVFGKYEIPFFSDRKQSVIYHPLIELIRALLEIADTDYSYESVFRYLRTGLAGFSPEETDRLENYCLEHGIHGHAKWNRPFLRPSRRHGRIHPKETYLQEELSDLNELRSRLAVQTEVFYKTFRRKDTTVKEKAETLYAFLLQLHIEEQIHARQESYEAAGREVQAGTYRQIYRVVIDLLDKMVDLMQDEVLSVSEFQEILEAGFDTARIGHIPPGNDCVILGDIERTRLDGIRVLFFLGVNEGMIPKSVSSRSLLSQFDREQLTEEDITLSPSAREQVFLQRFYLYFNMTKPSDALYLSFSRTDPDGKAIRESYLINVIKKLFCSLQTEEIPASYLLFPETDSSGLDTCLTGLLLAKRGVILPDWKALVQYYAEQPDRAPLIREYFDLKFRHAVPEALTARMASELYGSVLMNSVTRLERYAECAYAHFLEYGLKLSERNTFSFESVDMGSMFHDILRRYCERLDASYSWETITGAEQEQLLQEAMHDSILSLPNESLLESARSEYVLERIYRIMKRSVWAITEQIRRGSFRPDGYEMEFVQTDHLDEDILWKTVGKVDRIDTWQDGDRMYVKIIDYKSGNAKFQLLQLYYGMQLQLVVYLNAVMENYARKYPGKEILPGGIFYCHLDDPMIEDGGLTPEEAELSLLREFRVNGLVNANPEVYLHMDSTLCESRKSDVIPVVLNKDLSLGKTGTAAAAPQQFGLLSAYVKDLMKEYAQKILSGDIAVSPGQLKDRSACEYCVYGSVCGFDRKTEGYAARRLDPLKEDEIWERIADREEEDTNQ